jgi:hypothetical protein
MGLRSIHIDFIELNLPRIFLSTLTVLDFLSLKERGAVPEAIENTKNKGTE